MWKCQLISIIVIFGTTFLHVPTVNGDDRTDAIDKYIRGLNYVDEDVLVFKGEGIEKVVPNSGYVDENASFIVTSRAKKTVENSATDATVVASNVHRTHAGALLLANSKLVDNNPSIVRIKRDKLLFSVDFPGMTKEHSTFEINPTYANYRDGLRKVVDNWHDIYAPKGVEIEENIHVESSLVENKDQLRVDLGGDFQFSTLAAGINFKRVSNNEESVMIVQFKQIFYTVSVREPKRPSELFGESITVEDLKKKKISDEEPPVLVDSVSYGRLVYCKIETSSTDSETKVLLKQNITDMAMGYYIDFDYGKHFKDLSMKVYVLGGNTKQMEILGVQSIADVKKILKEHGEYSRENPGFPLSYSTIFLRDNNRATIQSSAEYVETTREVFRRGSLSIEHYGAYTTQWDIYWSELSYDEEGNAVWKHSGWYKNWKDINAPFSEQINLGGNCRNIRIYARGYTGLLWEKWRTILDYYDLSLLPWRGMKTEGWSLGMTHSHRT